MEDGLQSWAAGICSVCCRFPLPAHCTFECSELPCNNKASFQQREMAATVQFLPGW